MHHRRHPLACLSVGALLWVDICRRLLRPPDLGSGGKQVIDLETEAKEAVGLYIERDQFPDRLFAPPKRTTFLPENANPIYDKEIRSEIFSQGTLMLRLVIQISMGLALPVMAVCLFMKPWLARVVHRLRAACSTCSSAPCSPPAASPANANAPRSICLLTTLITPWQMLWGKLLSGLRVSSVLTCFLLWPVFLACVMPVDFWPNLLTMGGYFLIVGLTAVTTAMTALFCSTLFRRSSTSLMCTYLVIDDACFWRPSPPGRVHPNVRPRDDRGAAPSNGRKILSPFAAAFNLPLVVTDHPTSAGEHLHLLGLRAVRRLRTTLACLWR